MDCRIVILASLTLAATSLATASSGPEIDHSLAIELVEVTAKSLSRDELSSEAPVTRPTHDAGELLRSVTGMTALRRGGRGFDPIIRGQSQANLNIIANGAFSYGACPGRMDPPSTYIGVDSFDSVSVIKGHRSVIYGAGGSGGTLLFEHRRPELSAAGFTGSITSGYTGNSDLKNLGADLAAGNDRGYLRLFGARKRSGNYRDGNGNPVASAFDSETIGLVAAIDINPRSTLEINHERASEEDIWYAGNGMDAVYADSASTTVKWRQRQLGPVDELEVTLYRSDVDHLMDNYTVRNRNTVADGMAAPSTSDTWGGRVLAILLRDDHEWRFGLDHRANDRGANLYMDRGTDGSYDMLVARIWPDVRQRQTGLFAELDRRINARDTLRLGLRLDTFESRAADATISTGMMGSATPATLYREFYGSAAGDQDDMGVSAVVGWDRTFANNMLFSVNLSRSVRTPDASEQWIARRAGGAFWVGDPELAAEIHHQLDLTLMRSQGALDWTATVFVDEVADYIERYQDGNADLYRNSGATLYGTELDGSLHITDALEARLGLSWTRGTGDNGDLAQIAPLEARLNLDYRQGTWGIGAEWVGSARQTHFNPAIDVDEPTAGFGVLHLYGHWNVNTDLIVEAGVENLFDRNYAYHVNAGNADPFYPDAVRVNEPGRQSWVKLRYQF
ncbi:TonB-dependent receptor domain-containing protein [Kineobactrum sediminis]|nr:TonB-dependent receptor [Kineobactrum sediminis]